MGSNFKKTVLELSLPVQVMTYTISYRTKTLQEYIMCIISDFVSGCKTFLLFKVTEMISSHIISFSERTKQRKGKLLMSAAF